MNGDLVTLCFKHQDKSKGYYICKVRKYLNHRDAEMIQYLAIKRVVKAMHEFSQDIITDSTYIFEPVDVKDVELYHENIPK